MKRLKTRRKRFAKPNDTCRYYANGPYVLVVSRSGQIVTVMPKEWLQ